MSGSGCKSQLGTGFCCSTPALPTRIESHLDLSLIVRNNVLLAARTLHLAKTWLMMAPIYDEANRQAESGKARPPGETEEQQAGWAAIARAADAVCLGFC